jgi:hypothetical protein
MEGSVGLPDVALVRFLAQRSPLYRGKLEEVVEAITKWLEYTPATFPHYTSHTAGHSETILAELSNLLFDQSGGENPTIALSGAECYVLCASAYLHDAGMVVPDDQKVAILGSPEWREWVAPTGFGHARFQEIKALRDRLDPPDDLLRHFLADRELRYLIADFVRRTHADRSRRLVDDMAPQIARLDLGDAAVRRTIADVCAGHGMARQALQDSDLFPDRRDLRGEEVNVRLMAILLRLGDLLDMSQDRACPLAMSAASPLPLESIAHWTKYSSIVHRLTAPDVIELAAKCGTADEDRFVREWCQWIVDELDFARAEVPRMRRHGAWKVPLASLSGPGQTIRIGPSETAPYLSFDWRFTLEQEAVFDHFVRKVYTEQHAFVRELIQNALDATRCRMYDDMGQSKRTPYWPSGAPAKRRARLPIRVGVRWTTGMNDVAGSLEKRQEVWVDDAGVGMDEDKIQNYFLQVGKSYYTTPEFSRRYAFAPSNRHGIGFLSVFAECDRAEVDTLSRGAKGPSLRMVLNGPRRNFRVEKGSRAAEGTTVRVRLLSPLRPGELTELVSRWCRRVEFPVVVDDLGTVTTLNQELPGSLCESVPRRDGGFFHIRSFPIRTREIHGEIYVRAVETEGQELWTSHWYDSKGYDTLALYLKRFPLAPKPSLPLNLLCVGGLAQREDPSWGPWSVRADYRGSSLQNALVPRSSWFIKPDWFLLVPAVRNRLISALEDHVRARETTVGEPLWEYRQQLSSEFPIDNYWENQPIVPLFRHGHASLVSVGHLVERPEILVVRPRGKRRLSPPSSDATVVEYHTHNLSQNLAGSLNAGRKPTRVTLSSHSYSAIWSVSTPSPNLELKLWENWNTALCEFDVGENLQIIGCEPPYISGANSQPADAPAALNIKNPLVAWLVSASELAEANVLPTDLFHRLLGSVVDFVKHPSQVDEVNRVLENWRSLGLDPALPVAAVSRDQVLNRRGEPSRQEAWERETARMFAPFRRLERSPENPQ